MVILKNFVTTASYLSDILIQILSFFVSRLKWNLPDIWQRIIYCGFKNCDLPNTHDLSRGEVSGEKRDQKMIDKIKHLALIERIDLRFRIVVLENAC